MNEFDGADIDAARRLADDEQIGVLLDLARSEGFDVRQGWFPLAEMASSEEAFTSSSVREVMPIVGLDGRPIGDGRPGPAAATLQAALRRMAEAEAET